MGGYNGKKIYLTGGIGAEPGHEGFGPAYELPNATAYTETCAAISLMFWNHRLFLLEGKVKYMDVFERTLYNGFLSSVSFEGDNYFYPNPLEFDGKFKFNRGVCGRSEWFDCSCCPVNIVRLLPSLPGYNYATKDDTVFINLFIGSSSEIKVNNEELLINQKTNYPYDGRIEFTFGNKNPVKSKLNIRVPGWYRDSVIPGDLYEYKDKSRSSVELIVNGINQTPNISNGYIILDKKEWSTNDKIEVNFKMRVKKVLTNKKVISNINKLAFEYGPIVYCAEQVDNTDGVIDIIIDEDVKSNFTFDENLLNGIGKIELINSSNSNKITMIPYYAWANRKLGEMAVWLNTN